MGTVSRCGLVVVLVASSLLLLLLSCQCYAGEQVLTNREKVITGSQSKDSLAQNNRQVYRPTGSINRSVASGQYPQRHEPLAMTGTSGRPNGRGTGQPTTVSRPQGGGSPPNRGASTAAPSDIDPLSLVMIPGSHEPKVKKDSMQPPQPPPTDAKQSSNTLTSNPESAVGQGTNASEEPRNDDASRPEAAANAGPTAPETPNQASTGNGVVPVEKSVRQTPMVKATDDVVQSAVTAELGKEEAPVSTASAKAISTTSTSMTQQTSTGSLMFPSTFVLTISLVAVLCVGVMVFRRHLRRLALPYLRILEAKALTRNRRYPITDPIDMSM